MPHRFLKVSSIDQIRATTYTQRQYRTRNTQHRTRNTLPQVDIQLVATTVGDVEHASWQSVIDRIDNPSVGQLQKWAE
jgi:hypothetical protein